MRSGDLAQVHRVDRREAEVEHLRAEPVALRVGVLLQVAELGERRDVAVRRAPAQVELARELADADQRAVGVERGEDREAALERLRRARASLRGRHAADPSASFHQLEHRLDKRAVPLGESGAIADDARAHGALGIARSLAHDGGSSTGADTKELLAAMSSQSLEDLLQTVGNPVDLARNSQIGPYVYPRFRASSRTGGTSSTPGVRRAVSSTSRTT